MLSVTRHTTRVPATDVSTLERRINRLFTDAFGSAGWQSPDSALAEWAPAVDILEEPDAIRILAELPGVKPGDVKISLENNVLTVQGSKQQLAEERTERVHRYERSYGALGGSFTLPATVDVNRLTASYDLGVLTITLPKVEKARPKQIQVEVASR